MKLPELRIGNLTARLPVVQGGMSVRISTSSLASAVAECGGIGTIGGSGVPIDELKEDIRRAKQMTHGIIAVNIMFAIRHFMETVMASIEAGVDMIVTGAGFSRDIFKVGKDHNVPIVSIVSSPEFGKLAERCGADAIVVEAKEAGGHLGTDRPLRELFPEIRKIVKKVPLIAAGGITDGYEIAEMMGRYGADAVQMATRFVLTKECDVPDSFKNAYLNARKEDISLMQSPVGLPGRAIRNRFLDRLFGGENVYDGECKRNCLKSCDHTFCIIDRLDMSRDGDTEDGLVFAGENVWKIKDIPTVRELMGRLVAEAESVYASAPA
ncbi:MAG TPA: nitronate monooxygenase family protein [Candidatus Limnocylindria bacterium]|nr:nitronate monooxygenase family protein [Candidatus Limnocylindria bacterium]